VSTNKPISSLQLHHALARLEHATPEQKPLFNSQDDFVTTSRRLVQHKQLVDQRAL